MANMRTLIRIVFVIFIANGIDCLGEVCDNCCDCLKDKKEDEKKDEEKEDEEKEDEKIEEYEEIKEDKNNTAKSLVNDAWYNAKENKPILKIFKKKADNDIFTSKENGDKISIKLDEKGNFKIEYLNETGNEHKLEDKKYAFFEIKTNTNTTVYLYCSDVESFGDKDADLGIFEGTDHKSISIIACDTKNIEKMNRMFANCKSLEKLEFGKNFNTTKVTDMHRMFSGCNGLTELDIRNFNTTNVTNMFGMFSWCSSLKNLNLENFNTTKVTNMQFMFSCCNSLTNLNLENFNTTNVTNMMGMFKKCSKLIELDLKNFNTEKVTNMWSMFSECSNLKNLDISNFNTSNIKSKGGIFYKCENLPQETQNKILNKNK